MKLKVLLGMVMSILALTIVGCGGGGSSAPVSTTLTGEAVKGPIKKATVEIFAINADGSEVKLTTTPSTVFTNMSGNYSAVIGYAGPVKVKVTGNSDPKCIYVDEATGTEVRFTNARSLSAVVDNVSGSAKVAVTPHTELAVQALKKAGTKLTPESIKAANTAIADAMGLKGVDIVKELPSANNDYKFALAVISQAAGITDTGLGDKLTIIANGIDLTSGTIKDPEVSTELAFRTGEAFQNPIIKGAGLTQGIVGSAVSAVKITAPTGHQQNITNNATTATVPIKVNVTRVDGDPARTTTVSFKVTTGSGKFTNASDTINATTDDNGVATVNLSSNAEETVILTATAGNLTSSSTIIFEDLYKPGTVTLKADALTGITKGNGPVTLTATVIDLAGRPLLDGNDVTFTIASPSTTGTLSAIATTNILSVTVKTGNGGVATATLNSNSDSQGTPGTPADSLSVSAAAGTGTGIKTSGSVPVNFIFQPKFATLKLSTPATLPAGMTKITALIGTLSIKLDGITVNPGISQISGIYSAGPDVVKVSGVALTAFLLPTEVTLATTNTPATPTKVLVSLASIDGFGPGEFATIVTDVATGKFPKPGDFELSLFNIVGVNASGAEVKVSNVTVDSILSLQ